MKNVPVNLCNDLNRLTAINLISLLFDKQLGTTVNLHSWKNGFLRDIGILMVYHQLLSYLSDQFDDSDMVDDLIKTSVLLLVPYAFNLNKANWKLVATILAGVVVYHKVVRGPLIDTMNKRAIGFNSGIEDIVETILLLSMTREKGISSIFSQLVGVVIYHGYLRYEV